MRKVRQWEERKKSPQEDGCVWQAGPSRVFGQEAERGEGRPDETTSSTWVPLTVYICPLPSAQSQPIPPASPYGGLIVVVHRFSFYENSFLLPSYPFHFFFRCRRRSHHFAHFFHGDRAPLYLSMMSSVFVSHFIVLILSQNCSITHFPRPAVKWMNLLPRAFGSVK